MREDDQDEARLWESVSSADGDTKVDALLQLSYNAAEQQEYTEALAFCETARETYEALGAQYCGNDSENLGVISRYWCVIFIGRE
jgi:hypothetical protein